MTLPEKSLRETGERQLSHPKYRPDIDGMRAIAVMSVVLFHAFPTWLPGGFIGVDIFFVISGYLISTIIFGSLQSGSFSFRAFYSRRINRIFPALIVVLASCYMLGWFTLFPDEFQQLGKHLAGGSVFISNFVLWSESGYFDNTAGLKPLLHLWSLGIEEQFYILWPVLLWAAWKLRLNFLVLLAIAICASFIANIEYRETHPSATFYLPHSRSWELLLGALLAYAASRKGRQPLSLNHITSSAPFHKGTGRYPDALADLSSAAGLALLGYGFFNITSAGFPGWQAVIPGLGALLVIAAGPNAWLNKKILSSRLFVWLGLISFPLYLWHWPLLSFAHIIESDMPSTGYRLFAVVASIALAYATLRFIEKPLRRVAGKRKTGVLVALMAVTGAAGFYTWQNDGLPQRSAATTSSNIAAQIIPVDKWPYTSNDICMNKYPYVEASQHIWFCTMNKDAPPTIVLLGSSYANHLYPGMVESLPGHTVLSIGTCFPGLPDVLPLRTGPCAGDRPKRQADFIDTIIATSGSVKLVTMDIHYLPPTPDYIERLEKRVAYFDAMGIRVVIFIPHLTMNYSIKSCLSRPLKTPQNDCFIPEDAHTSLLKGLTPVIDELSSRYPGVRFFDQNEAFKVEGGYSMLPEGIPAFRDEYYHYSEYASKRVGDHFSKWIEKNALLPD